MKQGQNPTLGGDQAKEASKQNKQSSPERGWVFPVYTGVVDWGSHWDKCDEIGDFARG
jgi:hypothetical protein